MAGADDDRPLVESRHPVALSVFVLLGVLIQVLDATIANVALPHMQASLSATPDSISWVLTSYIIASAMVIPATGWLANRMGARALFIGSVALFMTASALCGIAANLPQMVVFRILQGIGGAALMPLGQSILLNTHPPSRHPQTLAYYSMGVTVGPVIGPIIGGWLTENFNWRWIFLVNLPIGAVCLVGLWLLMPPMRSTPRRFDVGGWLMIAIALAAFQLLLDRGEHVDWFNSAECWIEAGVALSAFWMFCVHSAFVAHPLIPGALLKDRNFVIGSIFQFTLAIVQFASLALLPTMMQTLFGYPVLETGILLATRGVAVVGSLWVAGKLVGRVGAVPLAMIGLIGMSYSVWLMTGWSLDMDQGPIVISGFLQGAAQGMIFLPLSVLVFSTIPADLRTDASGVTSLFRNTGGSIGIAMVSTVFARNIQISHADLAAHVTPYNLPIDPSLVNRLGDVGSEALGVVDGIVNRQATMIAFLDSFQMMFLVSLLVSPLLLLVRKGRPPAAEDLQAVPHE